jgi:hypothetical protein
MWRIWLCIVILLSGVLTVSDGYAKPSRPSAKVAAACVPPKTTALKVTLRPQKTNMWCWAASGQMVMEYLGKAVQQCTEANNRFGRNDCCNTPTPAACVMGGWPEFNKYGFTFKTTTNAALPWPTLQAQLAQQSSRESVCLGRPFAFSWHWVGGGGHMMVATGYTTDTAGKQYVFVNNPWPPNVGATQAILYSVYVTLPGDHTHWDDYYDVK